MWAPARRSTSGPTPRSTPTTRANPPADGGLHPAQGVFDRDAAGRVDPQHPCRLDEDVRRGLGGEVVAFGDHAVHHDREAIPDAGCPQHLLGVLRARDDRHRRSRRGELVEQGHRSRVRRDPLGAQHAARSRRSCDCRCRTRCRLPADRRVHPTALRRLGCAAGWRRRRTASCRRDTRSSRARCTAGAMFQEAKSSSNIRCHACMCTSAVGVMTPSRSNSTRIVCAQVGHGGRGHKTSSEVRH